MKSLSILHIDYDDLENTFGSGGQAVITKQLYKGRQKYMRVVVLTGNYPGAKNITKNGIFYKRLGFGNFGSQISLLSFWAFVPFAIFFMQNNFDIIVEFFTAPFSASLGFLTARKPYLAAPTFLGAKQLSQKYALPLYIFEALGLKYIKHFLVPSEFMAQRIKEKNSSATIYILPYGCDDDLQKTKAKEKKYVLYLGRIDIFNKGLDIVIKGWKEVIRKYHDIVLFIAGNGKPQDEANLQLLIQAYGLEENICFLGRVIGKQKIKLLASCLFTIIPSRFETFCLVALESLTIGKPVVSSTIPGLSWIPDDVKVTYPTNNPQAFADACTSLIANKKARQKIAKAAKNFTKNRSWRLVTKQYYQLLRNFTLRNNLDKSTRI